MIRVAWFLTDLRAGGAETLPLTVLPALEDVAGVVVLLKNRVELTVPSSVEVRSLSSSAGRLRGRVPEVVGGAGRLARRADLLVGGMEGAPLIVAALAGLLARRPVVGVVPTHLGRHHEELRFGALEWAMLRWALGRCRAVVTASEDARASLVELGPAPGRVRVIPNPYSPWASRVSRGARPSGPPRLITVGRLDAIKGMDVALEAAVRLGDRPFEWAFVGSGPDRCMLEERAVTLGLGDRVRFAGFVPDLATELARADVFVLASRVEGLSIAMLEAMAVGVPVVATRSGRGTEDALAGGEAGVLVAPGDPVALAGAISALLDDPARQRALAEAGRARARGYAPETIAARYRQVFEDALRPGSRR